MRKITDKTPKLPAIDYDDDKVQFQAVDDLDDSTSSSVFMDVTTNLSEAWVGEHGEQPFERGGPLDLRGDFRLILPDSRTTHELIVALLDVYSWQFNVEAAALMPKVLEAFAEVVNGE